MLTDNYKSLYYNNNKCINLVGDAGRGGGLACMMVGGKGNSELSIQFYCKCETAVEIKSIRIHGKLLHQK